VVAEQIKEAIEAPKCHPCGCLHNTVEALGSTTTGLAELAPVLSQARAVFQTKQYDCLGCPVCYPAIAANAFSPAFPELGSALNLCPTEEAEERVGWPPLPGNYHVLRYRAAVAVCTLNSEGLASSAITSRKDWRLSGPCTPKTLESSELSGIFWLILTFGFLFSAEKTHNRRSATCQGVPRKPFPQWG
jgi:hypothetical protein